MSDVKIIPYLLREIKEDFPLVEDKSNWWGKAGNLWNRHLVFRSVLTPEQDEAVRVRFVLRYERVEDDPDGYWTYLELQVLDPEKFGDDVFRDLAEDLQEKKPSNETWEWSREKDRSVCRYRQRIGDWDVLWDALKVMQDSFNPHISRFVNEEEQNSVLEYVPFNFKDTDNDVELYTMTLLQVLNLKLRIPDYQRIYCWDEKTVRLLWEDVCEVEEKEPYRLGTIILQRQGDEFHIIDGQQRLVTLALFLSTLHIDGISLLDEKYLSAQANDYVGYNKHLIKNYLSRFLRDNRRNRAERLWSGIEFNVLVLNESSLDLAYTFFSNENSRGKDLSDFDLLKAHHLRFLANDEGKSMSVAQEWDKMILEGDKEAEEKDPMDRSYERSLARYVFRLRHWIRMKEWEEGARYNVKNEYESGTVLGVQPPSVGPYDWNESIQGGARFFGYTDSILDSYKAFTKTNVYQSIHRLDSESHWWYRDVIEALLFGYYLKFKDDYLADAFALIATRISDHRYKNGRAHLGNLLLYAGETRIIMMVDRAASPAFFLGELRKDLSEMVLAKPKTAIQNRYATQLRRCLDACKGEMKISLISNWIG